MMNRLVFLVPMALTGCSGALFALGDGPTDVVLQPETVLLDELPGVQDMEVGTDQIVLETDGSEHGVREGSVVVGRRDGGYLRRVSEVIEQGDRIVLRTEPAVLADAIQNGKVNTTVHLDELRAATTWDLGGRVLVDETLWSDAEGNFVDVSVFIADGAHLTVDPTFDFDLELFNGSWIDAGFDSQITLAYDADFVANVSGRYDGGFEQTVLSRSIPFAFEMGPVPVVGTAHIDIIAGIDGSFAGEGETTLHTEADAWATLSAGYDGDWYGNADGDFAGDLGFTETNFDQTMHTRVYLRAHMDIELYGSAGATLDVEPWLEANSCGTAGIDVDGGLKGSHAYRFEALGWDLFAWGPYGFDAGVWNLWELECAVE
jgi:hypothetical protein